MRIRRQRRRRPKNYELVLLPNDGRPARRFGLPGSILTILAAALIANVAFIAILTGLYGNQRLKLGIRAVQVEALDEVRRELVLTTEEQEAQLLELAQEAEQLNDRLRDLEQLSDEVWTLLGKTPDASGTANAALAGRGGPDDAAEDLGAQTSLALGALSAQVPLQHDELQQLRQLVVARNHRRDHTPSIWPASGYVSSEYGSRIHPISGRAQPHNGIDIAALRGTPVYAPADGVVTYAGDRGGYGLTVVIDHGYGVETLYAHNSRLHVSRGQVIRRGDLISAIGTTGISTGPHLHYEVMVNGKHVNPRTYLP